jgi:hypothetical protein
VAFRTRGDLAFIESNDLKLYRNSPETAKDTYIGHRQVDGVGLLVQAEADMLRHNLLSATDDDSTVVESARAGDVQTLLVINTTQVAVDLVYKDLPYILFNVPGLTSGVAMDPDMEKTPQLYARGRVEHYFPNAHVTPSLGFGLMRPATYKTASGTFVQYSETEKEQVPEGQEAAAILSGVLGAQIDFSKSVIMLGELLYTVDNNLSDFVSTTDEAGIVTGGERIPSSEEERNAIGFNLMLRARF